MMRLFSEWYWPLDGWIVLAGILCAVSASLIGNFLVLRRMSLLGDAISHAILPGLAIAFLWSASRSGWPVFVAAVAVGILTAFLSQLIHRQGRVDEGAAMGVVFTTLFAAGLLLINHSAKYVDLDPSCVLYGAIEFTPLDQVQFLELSIPRVVLVLSAVAVVNLLFVTLLFKELQITTFAPELAKTMGIPGGLIHYSLMALVAVTAVAAFESVGSILVVAMFIVPPAAALLITDRLSRVIFVSTLIGAAGATLGHVMAIAVPPWFGFRSASTAGMMAVAVGFLFLGACLLGPRHGLLVNAYRFGINRLEIAFEDIIAFLYRRGERAPQQYYRMIEISEQLKQSAWFLRLALWVNRRKGLVQSFSEGLKLTPLGTQRAQEVVRSHRLWETYLAEELSMPTERLHDAAEDLEHFTDKELRTKLGEAVSAQEDPHGTPIPPE
ncbi:MAG: metal ABC transporter permease [Pirellulaceae bacterium]|nr:metal ABC transporter permease [Pirellulaceae bacterium]